MKDNLSIVITMLVFVILIVIFPLYNYFERQDDMSYNLVLKATTNFVDEVLQAGYMDQEMYNKYVSELSDTGNIYDIELESHRKILIEEPKGSNKYKEEYIIEYNNDIFNENGIVSNLNEKVVKDSAYYFNQGDQFYVKTKNSNTTMAGAIFNTIVPTASKDRIVINYGGIIKNQSWAKVDATYRSIAQESNTPIVTSNPSTVLTDLQVSPGTTIQFSAEFTTKNYWEKVKEFKWEITEADSISKVVDECTIANIDASDSSKYTAASSSFTTSTGAYIIKVYAIYEDGSQSEPYNELFISQNVETSENSKVMGLVYNEIKGLTTSVDNFYVNEISFDVYIDGHNSGNKDYYYIKGIKEDGTEEDICSITNTSNGTNSYKISGIADKKYKRVRLYYEVSSNHKDCLKNASKLNYLLKYKYMAE